jgi:hypothetical protein
VKEKLKLAASVLEATPATAELAQGLRDRFVRARREGMLGTVGALALVLLICFLASFILAMWSAPGLLEEVWEAVWVWLILFVVQLWPLSLAGLALVIVGLWWIRRLYLSLRLTQYLAEHLQAEPVVVAAAQQQISARGPELAFKAVSLAVAIFLLVVGAAWATLVFIATTAALDCARSSKCL